MKVRTTVRACQRVLMRRYDRCMISNTLAASIRAIHRHKSVLLLSAGLALWVPCAQASELRVASWNLGWHISQAEVPNWIAQCGKSYEKDKSDGIWKPTESAGTVGWFIKESRAKVQGIDLSIMPPCGSTRTTGSRVWQSLPKRWRRGLDKLATSLPSLFNPT